MKVKFRDIIYANSNITFPSTLDIQGDILQHLADFDILQGHTHGW